MGEPLWSSSFNCNVLMETYQGTYDTDEIANLEKIISLKSYAAFGRSVKNNKCDLPQKQ